MKKLTVLTTIAKRVTNATGRTGLLLKAKSPEILIVGGVIGMVGATFLACKATLKLDDILTETKVITDKIADAKINKADVYSEKDAAKDLYTTYVQSTVKVGKLYLPAVTLGALSIGCVLYSFKILKGRNVALMAAYKCVENSFSKYRTRVVADAGVEKDQEYRYGIRKQETTTTVVGKNGKEKEVKTTVDVMDGLEGSEYAVMFDESCSMWVKNPEYNMTTLLCQQQFANDMLNSRGHLFLNEVYDMLGAKQTTAGSVTGWVKGHGDSFVDFGIYEGKSADTVAANGYSKTMLLDFNVDGVIYDMI